MSDSENVIKNEEAEKARIKKFLKELGPTPITSNEYTLGSRWAPKDSLRKALDRIRDGTYHDYYDKIRK